MTDKIKEGSVLISVYGYEQTNVDFYQVTKITDRTVKNVTQRIAEIKPLSCNRKKCDDFSAEVTPQINCFTDGRTIRRKIYISRNTIRGDIEYVRIYNNIHAHLWNGKPEIATNYC